MKKAVAFLLIVLLMSTYLNAFAASQFDMSIFTDNPNIFSIDFNSNKGVAFIESRFPIKDLAFTHKYESSYYYSTICSDILVIDYFKSNRYPVLRTWIKYSADTPLNIYAVSFEIDGETYTFSDVADAERIETLENGITETLLIRYGMNNWDFLSKIRVASAKFAGSYYGDDNPDTECPSMKMTLHGTEKVEVEIPRGFWDDFSLLSLSLTAIGGMDYVRDNDGTPCKN